MLKKYFLFIVLCLSILAFAGPIQDRQMDPKALAELAAGLNIAPDADLIAETQKQWLRKNKERWEMAELPAKERAFVLNWAKEQGLFTPWKPARKTYDTALILGATTSRMQMRLDYLKELWLQGVRFHEIVWLTGDRPLDSRVDGLMDRCSTESEAAFVIWEEADLPEEMSDLDVTFIAVHKVMVGSSLKRPNTEDTILAWLETDPQPCTALFVSDQPFCGYQFAIIKTCLPEFVPFDLVGQGADPSSHPAAAAITLDTIGRWMYQEALYQKKLQK